MSPLKLGEEGPISERDRFFYLHLLFQKEDVDYGIVLGFFISIISQRIVEAPEFLHKIPEYIGMNISDVHVVRIIHSSTLKFCKHTLRMLFGRPNLY